MISRMLWTDTWKLTVTKTTSVRVATKRLIGRYVIYRNIFQNIVKYFELIISTYIISRMLWTDIRKCTSDVARNGNILVMYVVKYSAIYFHSKPSTRCPSSWPWETYEDADPANEEPKNWWTRYV
jgi:hypothetical protein